MMFTNRFINTWTSSILMNISVKSKEQEAKVKFVLI